MPPSSVTSLRNGSVAAIVGVVSAESLNVMRNFTAPNIQPIAGTRARLYRYRWNVFSCWFLFILKSELIEMVHCRGSCDWWFASLIIWTRKYISGISYQVQFPSKRNLPGVYFFLFRFIYDQFRSTVNITHQTAFPPYVPAEKGKERERESRGQTYDGIKSLPTLSSALDGDCKIVGRWLSGKQRGRSHANHSASPSPASVSALNDVFSIHFSAALLIAGKFRPTVGARGPTARMHAAVTAVMAHACRARLCTSRRPPGSGSAYCRHYNRSDYRGRATKSFRLSRSGSPRFN